MPKSQQEKQNKFNEFAAKIAEEVYFGSVKNTSEFGKSLRDLEIIKTSDLAQYKEGALPVMQKAIADITTENGNIFRISQEVYGAGYESAVEKQRSEI